MAARRRAKGNTESVDNYLKAILSLGGAEEGRVTIKALAGRLSVAPASVTNMLQKLALSPEPLVEYERHGGVQLSSAGKRRALEVVRHHRLIETFLYQVLDYPIEELHEEAERLEHFISERFEQRIAAKLGTPQDRSSRTLDPDHGGEDAGAGVHSAGGRRRGWDVCDRQRRRPGRAQPEVDRGLRDHSGGAAAGQEKRVIGGLFGEDRPLFQGLRSLPRGCTGHTGRSSAEVTVRRGTYEFKNSCGFSTAGTGEERMACKENGGQQIVCRPPFLIGWRLEPEAACELPVARSNLHVLLVDRAEGAGPIG